MRSLIRETVFKYIYSKLFNDNDEGLFDVLIKGFSDEDKKFAISLLKSYTESFDENLNKLSELSHSFKINRIFSVDKCIILLAITELDSFKDTPTAIIIDEYVSLSVKFSTEKSVGFINGILANYSKDRKNV